MFLSRFFFYIFLFFFLIFYSLLSAMNISDTARPATILLHSSRNGRSVTPAMGATISGLGKVYGPIFAVGSMI